MNHKKYGLDFMTVEVHPTSLVLFMRLEAEEIGWNVVSSVRKEKRMNTDSVWKNIICNLMNNTIANIYNINRKLLSIPSFAND